MSRTVKRIVRVSRGNREQLEKAKPRKTLADMFPLAEPSTLDVDLGEPLELPAFDVDVSRVPGFDEDVDRPA